MKLQPVHLLCGVPGSGKTWIAEQLGKKFTHIPHDDYEVSLYGQAVIELAGLASRPVLAEAPFRMSVLEQELRDAGLTVHSYFIVEPEEKIIRQYEARDGKPIPAQHLKNFRRLLADVENRFWTVGSSEAILELLKNV